MDGFAMLSYAAEDQDTQAVSQEQDVAVDNAADPAEMEADAAEPEVAPEQEAEDFAVPEAPDDFAADEDSELVYTSVKANKVRLEGLMPEGAKVTATDASGTKAVKKLDAADETTLAAYDITINADGEEYQPDSENPILVQISDKAIKEDSDLTIWHIKDNGKKERVKGFEISKGKVTFEATGFSVYAIVEGPAPHAPKAVVDLIELAANYADPDGFLISYIDANNIYHYTTSNLNGTNAFIETTNVANASKWYLESAGADNTYYIYTYLNNSSEKSYMWNSEGVKMALSTNQSQRTAFEMSQTPDTGKFFFKIVNGNYWLQHSGSGSGMRLYNANDNKYNARLIITYASSVTITEDPYKAVLDGKEYGLMVYDGGNSGKALMAEANGSNALKAELSLVMSDKQNNKVFAPVDTDMSMWTFTWSGDEDYYYVHSEGKYLKITRNGLSLVDDQGSATKVRFVPGTGTHTGMICLKTNDATLTYNGSIESGFSVGGSTGSEWLHLVEVSPGDHDNYLRTYSASKVSVSDVENGAHIIIYTRVWDKKNKQYKFYAVDGEGKLTQCYESGDSIQWLGGQTNNLLWDFTEYYWEDPADPKVPNDYYDFYNEASHKYLAPQVTDGQLVSPEKIGVNLNGRTKGYYQTPIVAWDEGNYAFAGLKADIDNMTLVSCPIGEAADFYFAIMEELPVDDSLNDVKTIDHEQYGITMKITDFDATSQYIRDNNPMSAFLNNDNGNANVPPTQGLLSTNLGNDGYPTATYGDPNKTLKTLLTGGHGQRQVNHLFIESTYKGTGYYEFDSTQNFASLKDDNKFKVYKELGTYDGKTSNTLKHGQFLPFNDIKPGSFAQINKYNQYNALAKPLPDSDPRKNENLYMAQGDANLYFAAEIEASFTQTPNGQDDWGHDIIYEFTGDDDFWLYVDGELVIDLGGVHSALAGSVNYATGDVVVNGKRTTLREVFANNFKKRNPSASATDVANYLAEYFEEGSTIFKAYTTHTMRIFYMERGGGASNLHMRFNLASVKPGTVELTKKLTGVENTETVLAEFPYQIYYKDSEDGEEHLLSSPGAVLYKDTVNKVPFRRSITIQDTQTSHSHTYNNVYMLKPGETAVIEFPETAKYYRIVECGVNTQVYKNVEVNNNQVQVNETHHPQFPHRADFEIPWEEIAKRPRVLYDNQLANDVLHTLTITKKLHDFNGITDVPHSQDDSTFTFRLSLGTEYDENPQLTNMYAYHVKDENGNYCKWDSSQKKFVSLGQGKSDFEQLTDAEKASATFHTSIRGSISNIPVDYSVEVRGLLAGTKFKVAERPDEIPDGYLFQEYVYNQDHGHHHDPRTDAGAGVTDTIAAHSGHDPKIDVQNKKVWALRVNKKWSDTEYMASRDPAYFAVFTTTAGSSNLNLVEGSVRRMAYGDEQTLYWYYETHLPVSGTTFDQYVVREVSVRNPSVDSETGVVTCNSVTPIAQGESITYNGTPVEGAAGQFHYSVDYKDVNTGKAHVKQITATNNRNDSPVILKKTDMERNPLKDVVFTRKNDSTGREFTHTSDADGIITNAYLQEGVTYTVTETKSAKGYQAPEKSYKIKVQDGTVTVTTENAASTYELTQKTDDEPATLIIKNQPYTLTLSKEDRDSGQSLSGAVFSLEQKVTTGGATSYQTVQGYDNLTTGSDGKVLINAAGLEAATYQLRENTPPSGYQSIPIDNAPQFTISDTGYVTLESEDPGYLSHEVAESPDKTVQYTLTVKNDRDTVAPTGYSSYLWPLIWMMILGMFLWTAMTYMRRRRSLDGYAMAAADIDDYDGFATDEDAYDEVNDEVYDDHDVADINADTDFAVNETSEESAAEVRSETSETSYEAFDWTRIKF